MSQFPYQFGHRTPPDLLRRSVASSGNLEAAARALFPTLRVPPCHFGIVLDGSRHRDVDGLMLEVTARYYAVGRRVSDEVLAAHGRKLGAMIADLWLLAQAEYTESDPDAIADVEA